MKRLLIALVAAVAVSTGFAKLTYTQDFEGESVPTGDFVPSVQDEDASELVAYDNDEPGFVAPYNFVDFGLKYLSLDTGDATLWRTNAGEAAYFDMVMQFNPSATAPEIDEDTKIAIYLNSENYLVVLSGDGAGGTSTNVTETTLAPGTWGRLTIASVAGGFKVTLNTSTDVGTFTSRKGDDKTIKAVGFKGSGALDDFVARTTDPFYTGEYVASVGNGGEKYATLDAALADNPTATFKLNADATTTKVLANRGDSISIELNGHELLSGPTAAGLLLPVKSVSGDVTTYTADYFPRTATAGQDGTAEHPFEVADYDDLQALSAAVDTVANFRNKCYVQTADIDMTSAGAFAGIGTYEAILTNGVAFAGTYDGAGYTISNVDFTQRNYGGIFNQVKGGTIKNLAVSNITCSSFSTGEWGCAIVGNAGLGAKLIGLTAMGSFGTTEQPCSHNVAGIVIRACGGASNVVDGVAMLETLVKDCTNNATLHGFYTKCAGITALTQDQDGVPNDYVLFDGCVNNANIAMVEATGSTLSKIGRDGLSGILGYVADGTRIKDCVNKGTLTSALKTAKIGGIVGWAQGRTLEDLGGNANMAAQKMIGDPAGSTITGFKYATVDNGVATTVTGALAKDTTYLLEGDVAASETPVFTLAAAGDTISFDAALGYTFAGTVAADTTTLVLAEPVTEGTVTTYSATAGVASVNDFAYATIEDAIAAVESAPADKQYVTLLADAEITFSKKTSVRVMIGTHSFTWHVATDDLLVSSVQSSPGITTYTVVEGVAKLNGTWYASFNAAYDAASASTDTLLVKVSSDFAPTLSASKAFASVTFTNESAAAIAIATASGDYAMTASTWVAPANATLTLSTNQTVASVTAGRLNVPAGITLSLANGGSLDGIGTGYLAGDGVVSLPAATVPTATLQLLLQKSAYWHGTFALNSTNVLGGPWNLTLFGNANSTVRFSNTGFAFNPDNVSAHAVKAIEVVGAGLYISGSDYAGGTITIPAKIIGSGKITVEATGSALYTVNFTGDFSEFAGDMEITSESNGRVYIGTGAAGNGKCISIAEGATATVAAGKTWNSQNGFVVLGTLNVAGTLKHQGGSAASKIYGAAATGKIVFKNAAAITTFGGDYAGDIVIDSIAAGATTTQVPLNFGCTTGKLTLNGVSGDAWCAGSDYTVQPEVTLAGDVNFQNGSSGKTVTFRKIAAGTGNLSLKTWSGCSGITYGFTTLDADNYTGTIQLDGSVMTFNVGDILKAGAQPGDKVLNLTVANSATVNLANAKLNGAAADLELKSDGVYYKESGSWPQPSEDTQEAVDTALEADGFSTDTGVVTNKAEYSALIEYVTAKTSATSPEGLTAAQKANAVLCYALQADAIPTTEIAQGDITIDALATGDDGAVDLTVAIDGVTVGSSVPAATLAKVVTAKGGVALNSMSTENVTVDGHVVETGKVKITVTPKADSPASFFTSVIVNK